MVCHPSSRTRRAELIPERERAQLGQGSGLGLQPEQCREVGVPRRMGLALGRWPGCTSWHTQLWAGTAPQLRVAQRTPQGFCP